MIPLTILGQSSLGPYRLITLGWPDGQPAPAPGQHLRLEDGTRLWPMRPASGGRLETLARAGVDLPASTQAALEGRPLPAPEGDLLLLAQGLGLAPLIQFCEALRHWRRVLALYEAPVPMPFRPRPSRFMVEGMPAGVIAAIPLLEDWGVPSRLASPDGLAGCHDGRLEDLVAYISAPGSVLAMGDADFLERMGSICTLAGHIEVGT